MKIPKYLPFFLCGIGALGFTLSFTFINNYFTVNFPMFLGSWGLILGSVALSYFKQNLEVK